jgi:VIT1/CCC1 family predicted Fe2+/Mn2+ transporter
VGASQRRDQLLERQRELRARHDELGGLGAEPPSDPGRLEPVFTATDELMAVVDALAVDAAQRRLLLTFVLLGVGALVAVLVAAGLLPAWALLAVVLLLAAAVALWLTTRPVPGSGP